MLIFVGLVNVQGYRVIFKDGLWKVMKGKSSCCSRREERNSLVELLQNKYIQLVMMLVILRFYVTEDLIT